MKKYQVIALSLGGLGNKIFKSGNIVTEKNFIEGRAEELVKQGFLKEVPEEEAEKATETEEAPSENVEENSEVTETPVEEVPEEEAEKATEEKPISKNKQKAKK